MLKMDSGIGVGFVKKQAIRFLEPLFQRGISDALALVSKFSPQRLSFFTAIRARKVKSVIFVRNAPKPLPKRIIKIIKSIALTISNNTGQDISKELKRETANITKSIANKEQNRTNNIMQETDKFFR